MSAALRYHLVYTQLKHFHQVNRWGGRGRPWHGLKLTSYLFYVAASGHRLRAQPRDFVELAVKEGGQ